MKYFQGRIGRAHFFWGQLMLLLISFGLMILVDSFFLPPELKVVSVDPEKLKAFLSSDPSIGLMKQIIGLISLVFSFGLIARRFRDLNMSGAYAFTVFVPVVNIWTFFETFFVKGKEPNRYGLVSSKGLFKDILGI